MSEPCNNAKLDIEALLRAVESDGMCHVETFKSDDRSTVRHVKYEQRDYVIKQYHISAVKWLVQGAVGLTPVQRELRGIRLLSKSRVRVNQPVAVSTGRLQVLVFGMIEGLSLHHFLLQRTDPAVRLKVLRATGRQAGELIAAGLVNRDFKPSNLIVDGECESGDSPPMVIDPLGIEKSRSQVKVKEMFEPFRRTIEAKSMATDEEWAALVDAAAEVVPGLR